MFEEILKTLIIILVFPAMFALGIFLLFYLMVFISTFGKPVAVSNTNVSGTNTPNTNTSSTNVNSTNETPTVISNSIYNNVNNTVTNSNVSQNTINTGIRRKSIDDCGYTNKPRGWLDLVSDGQFLDYCRYVGDESTGIYWSCTKRNDLHNVKSDKGVYDFTNHEKILQSLKPGELVNCL